MPVTRDADYPPHLTALFQAFNRSAEGYDANDVLDVAANFYIAALNYNCPKTATRESKIAWARANLEAIIKGFEVDIDGPPAGSIPVHSGTN